MPGKHCIGGDSIVEIISVYSKCRGSQYETLRGPKTTTSCFLPLQAEKEIGPNYGDLELLVLVEIKWKM